MGTIYQDAGATAFDNLDGIITDKITVAGNVNQYVPGQYTLTYNARDAAGNAATPVTRTVNVQDNTKPVLHGVPGDVTVKPDNIPAVATVTATDNVSFIVPVIYNQTRVDGTSPANYTLIRTWTATDEAGNTALGTQNIFVEGIVAPNPKTAIWDGDALVGNAGDGTSWSDDNNWSWPAGDINDLAPNAEAPGDDVVFKSSPSVGTINLESSRTVNSLSFEAGYTLAGHTLTVTTGNIAVNPQVVASIGSDIVSPAGINKTAAGALIIAATAPALDLTSGTLVLGRNGSVNTLTIGSGTLAILNGRVTGDIVNRGSLIAVGISIDSLTAAAQSADEPSSAVASSVTQAEGLSAWAPSFVVIGQAADTLDEPVSSNGVARSDDSQLVDRSQSSASAQADAALNQSTTGNPYQAFLQSGNAPDDKTARKELEIVDQVFTYRWVDRFAD